MHCNRFGKPHAVPLIVSMEQQCTILVNDRVVTLELRMFKDYCLRAIDMISLVVFQVRHDLPLALDHNYVLLDMIASGGSLPGIFDVDISDIVDEDAEDDCKDDDIPDDESSAAHVRGILITALQREVHNLPTHILSLTLKDFAKTDFFQMPI